MKKVVSMSHADTLTASKYQSFDRNIESSLSMTPLQSKKRTRSVQGITRSLSQLFHTKTLSRSSENLSTSPEEKKRNSKRNEINF